MTAALGFVHPDLKWALEVATGPFDNEFYFDRLDYFADLLLALDPACRLELEHFGIDRTLVDTLGERLGLRMGRMKEVLGLARNHRLPKTASGERIHGAPAFAALAILQLLGEALKLMDDCADPDIKWTFDTAEWLGRWMEKPQRALAGVRPAAIVALPAALPVLRRLIGAIGSGVYL